MEGKIGTIGITDRAQKELGTIAFVEFPPIGKTVKAGEEICVLESTKAAADVYAPVSGVIVEVNEAVRKTPSLINQAAEAFGWLLRLELSQISELDNLLVSPIIVGDPG